jgi:hypothetical protein
MAYHFSPLLKKKRLHLSKRIKRILVYRIVSVSSEYLIVYALTGSFLIPAITTPFCIVVQRRNIKAKPVGPYHRGNGKAKKPKLNYDIYSSLMDKDREMVLLSKTNPVINIHPKKLGGYSPFHGLGGSRRTPTGVKLSLLLKLYYSYSGLVSFGRKTKTRSLTLDGIGNAA